MSCQLRCRRSVPVLFAVLLIALQLSGPSLAICPISCPDCPCFTNGPFNFDVGEDTTVGTAISILTATSPSGRTLTYSTMSSVFNIDGASGTLSLGSTLDYESETTYQFRVEATDGINPVGRAEVTVNVLNRNEFSPRCSPDVIYMSVVENQGNAVFQLPNCTDQDTPVNPAFTYEINNYNDIFSVDASGQITLLRMLDFELRDLYDLTVVVQDTNVPPESLNTTIHAVVVVEPMNEFPPVFTSNSFVFSVSENIAIGSSVGQVTATDEDNGDDGQLTYSLTSGQTNTFAIDLMTGDIISIRTLDYETVSSYAFTVSVTDKSHIVSSRRSETTSVVINIVDSNDNAPVFMKPVYYKDVPENTNLGTQILQVSCEDLDSGHNGDLTYSILSGNDGAHFSIETDGNITLVSNLDYDNPAITDFFTLSVQCREVASPNRLSSALVLIEVSSYNMYGPQPTDIEFSATISENTLPGTLILRVEATDRDRGPAGVLRYYLNYGTLQLSSCPDDLISIDEYSGMVYLLAPLNYENGVRDIYCVVTIWDSGYPMRPAEVDLFITVTNANDIRPKCYPSVNTVRIPEDSNIGAVVFSLPCNDTDSASLQYTIASIGLVPFTIESNGDVVLQSQIDYEIDPFYVMPVQVSDGTFVINALISVLIDGVNEYSPAFTQSVYHCSVSEDAPIGTTLMCDINAIDNDDGMDGQVNYRILSSNPSNAFSVSPEEGDLILIASVDCEVLCEYSIEIEAFDLGNPPLSTSTRVNITVLDVNDNQPSMLQFIYGSVAENALPGTGITTVICTDADRGENGQVELQIVDVFENASNVTLLGLFHINPMDGVVTVLGDLDFESAHHYRLSILCSDHGRPSLSAMSTLFVDVLSVNEHMPMLIDPPSSLLIPEGTSIGTVLATFMAEDQDSSEDGSIRFSLLPPNTLPFDINKKFGELILSNSLNCDQALQYVLSVVVEDRGQPVQSSQFSLSVNITDCHSGNVIPDQNVYTTSMRENAPVGSSVLSVSCSSTRVSVLTDIEPLYRITSEGSELFAISNTGEISLLESPDFEAQHSLQISVECYDPNYTNIASNFSVFVNILPENEFAPEFTRGDVRVNVSESTTLGTSILRLAASDQDDGSDGQIIYQLADQDLSTFLVNQQTGEVYLTASIDRETMDVINFTVIAQDLSVNESLRQSTSTTVTVLVTDANDNWPRCSRVVYHLIVSPHTTVPSVLVDSFECADDDINENSELQYGFRGESVPANLFEINAISGSVNLIGSLDSSDLTQYYLPVAVRDNGVPALTTNILIIVDVQEPGLPHDISVGSDEYLSLVEAEGIKNSVQIVLEDFSTTLWKSMIAEENFNKAVAQSVTHYCALLPEACSLASGCSEFFGVNIGDNYPTFTEPSIVVLSNQTSEVHSRSDGATSLSVLFYVTLPPEANKSPYRETNYVVPRATLNLIVEHDGGTIEAVVRDSVSPPLTLVEEVYNGWMITALALSAIGGSALLIAIVSSACVAGYKYLQRHKNKVTPITMKPDSQKRSKKRVSIQTTSFANSLKRDSTTSTLSGVSTNEMCSVPSKGGVSISDLLKKKRNTEQRTGPSKRGSSSSHSSGSSAISNQAVCGTDVFISNRSDETTPTEYGIDDISEISLERASMENTPSRDRQGGSPRKMLDILRHKKGLETPSPDNDLNDFPHTTLRPSLKPKIPKWW